MSEEAELKVYPVTVKLPGGIWSPVTQDLRDQIDDWLSGNGVNDDDYDSFYMRDPDDVTKGDWYSRSIASNKYICFSFTDSRLAVMFKLAFG